MRKETLRIETINIIIGAFLAFGGYLLYKDAKISLSVALGSVIGGANFWALVRIFTGIFSDGDTSRALLGVFAVLKFLLLVLVLWMVMKFLPVNAAGLLTGLSTIIVSVLIGHARY